MSALPRMAMVGLAETVELTQLLLAQMSQQVIQLVEVCADLMPVATTLVEPILVVLVARQVLLAPVQQLQQVGVQVVVLELALTVRMLTTVTTTAPEMVERV